MAGVGTTGKPQRLLRLQAALSCFIFAHVNATYPENTSKNIGLAIHGDILKTP
jgi:hypothetical protein